MLKHHIVWGAVLLCTITSSSLFAEDKAPQQLNPIVVSAMPYQVNKNDLGQTVTILKGEDLRQLGAETLTDVFQLLPEFNVSNAGGSISMSHSGLPSNAYKFMIDGVSLFDPSSTQGTPFLNGVTLDQIDTIEILSGGQGTFHGSGAVAGVVNITTKQQTKDARGTLQVESYRGKPLNAMGLYTLPYNKYGTLTVEASRQDNLTQSVLPNGSEKDLNYFETLGFKGQNTNKWFTLDGSYRRHKNFADSDNVTNQIDDPESFNESTQELTGLSARFSPKSNVDSILKYTYTRLHRYSNNDADSVDPINTLDATYQSYTQTAGLDNRLLITDSMDVILGIENRRETTQYTSAGNSSFGAFSSSFTRKNQSFTRQYIGFNWLNPILSFRGSTALEQFSNKDAHTYALSVFRELTPIQTLVMASIRTGYRTPTLFEQFDDISGNPNLQAETSVTKELAIEKQFPKLSLQVRGFETRLSNAISYTDNNTPTNFLDDGYNNLTEDRTSLGGQVNLSLRPIGILNQVRLGYAHTYARETKHNASAKSIPLRAPERKLTAALGLKVNKYSLGLNGYYVDKQQDFGGVTLKAYHVLNLRAAYRINPQTEVYAKVLNLFDRKYTPLSNIQGQRRYILWGIRVQLVPNN